MYREMHPQSLGSIERSATLRCGRLIHAAAWHFRKIPTAARSMKRSGPAMAAIGMAAMLVGANAAAAQGGSPFPFSADPSVSAQQHAAYDVVHRYEQLLNSGDTAGILDLFAPESVAEWSDKPTFATRQEKADAYNALFKVAKFSTVFG
jgi:hypothetical protein